MKRHCGLGALGVVLASCAGGGAVEGLSLRLLDPDGVLDRAARLELTVYDEHARCVGAHASGGAALAGDRRTFEPTETVTLAVAPGHRTFALAAFAAADNSNPIGEGCKEADLAAGASVTLEIAVMALGGADMGLDLSVPADAAPPSDIAGPRPDQAPMVDLRPAPDLSVERDLSVPPDLAGPHDFATHPSTDLAGADLYSILPGDHCNGTALPPNVILNGTTRGYLNDGSGSCASGWLPDRIYSFTINQPQEVVINVSASSTHQAVYVVGGACFGNGAASPVEMGCVDTAGLSERLDLPYLDQGTYWIFVVGKGGGGDFTIQWQAFPPMSHD